VEDEQYLDFKRQELQNLKYFIEEI